MKEQNYTQGTVPPVEGRIDVAGDLEEEQRQAYSTHHMGTATQPEQNKDLSQAGIGPVSLPPVEGRVDVAGDIEEEQRQAYTAHHKG